MKKVKDYSNKCVVCNSLFVISKRTKQDCEGNKYKVGYCIKHKPKL